MTDLILPRRSLLATAAGLSLAAPPAFAQTTPQAGPPRRGGTLRFCRPDPPDLLDPQQTNSFSGMEYAGMIYDNLAYLDDNAQPQPQLGLSWTAEKGGQEWVVALRQGVKFHDGSTFGPADVVASVERSMDRARAGAAFGAFGPVKSIAAEGPDKVRFTMTIPFGEFPVILAFRHCRMLPAKGTDNLATSPNGTGPFVFKDFQPGSSITVERNPNYWDADRIHLDGVRMVFIREAVAMQAALRANQVDLLTQIPLETYLVMRSVRGFKAYSAVTGDYHCAYIQANMKPFDNPKVREAFRYILDRKTTVASILFGQGAVGNDVTLPPGDFYLPELPQWEQDLPKAKKLLDESGAGPIALDFYTTSDRQPAPKMVLAFSEAAAKIGVTLRVRDIPYTEYAANVARKMPMYTAYFSGSATLYDALYKIHHSKGIYNYSNTEVWPGLDTKLDAMISEVDTPKRKAIAAEVATILHEHTDRMVPYFRNYVGVTSDKVQGFVPPRYGVIETRNMWLSA